jgi:hypothetical protein
MYHVLVQYVFKSPDLFNAQMLVDKSLLATANIPGVDKTILQSYIATGAEVDASLRADALSFEMFVNPEDNQNVMSHIMFTDKAAFDAWANSCKDLVDFLNLRTSIKTALNFTTETREGESDVEPVNWASSLQLFNTMSSPVPRT